MIVPITRLKKLLKADFDNFSWNNNDRPITIEEIRSYRGKGNPIPFGDHDKFIPQERNRTYHLKRIVYFYRNPKEIKGVSLDDYFWRDRYRSFYFPGLVIDDGWHRFSAAIALKLKELDVNYIGCRIDHLNYLNGKRKKVPTLSLSL